MTTKITENTLVPISLVITIIGAIVWLTTIYNKTEANAAQIDKMSVQSDKISESLDEILVRLARIEERVRRKKE